VALVFALMNVEPPDQTRSLIEYGTSGSGMKFPVQSTPAPAGPVAPVAPVAPVLPVGPVAPVAPSAPFAARSDHLVVSVTATPLLATIAMYVWPPLVTTSPGV
jgi:hypothetical protein